MSLMLMLLADGTDWLLADWIDYSQAVVTFWLTLHTTALGSLSFMRHAAVAGLLRAASARSADDRSHPTSP